MINVDIIYSSFDNYLYKVPNEILYASDLTIKYNNNEFKVLKNRTGILAINSSIDAHTRLIQNIYHQISHRFHYNDNFENLDDHLKQEIINLEEYCQEIGLEIVNIYFKIFSQYSHHFNKLVLEFKIGQLQINNLYSDTWHFLHPNNTILCIKGKNLKKILVKEILPLFKN
jgi:hypothetical protein